MVRFGRVRVSVDENARHSEPGWLDTRNQTTYLFLLRGALNETIPSIGRHRGLPRPPSVGAISPASPVQLIRRIVLLQPRARRLRPMATHEQCPCRGCLPEPDGASHRAFVDHARVGASSRVSPTIAPTSRLPLPLRVARGLDCIEGNAPYGGADGAELFGRANDRRRKCPRCDRRSRGRSSAPESMVVFRVQRRRGAAWRDGCRRPVLRALHRPRQHILQDQQPCAARARHRQLRGAVPRFESPTSSTTAVTTRPGVSSSIFTAA